MAFREIVGMSGPIYKWQNVGQTLEGVYQGTRLGKTFEKGPTTLGVIAQADGVSVTFNVPTQLALRLQEIAPGTLCRITFTGTAKGKQPQPYKTFKVEVDDGAAQSSSAGYQGRSDSPATTPPADAEPADLGALQTALQAKLGKSYTAMAGALEKAAGGDEAKLIASYQTTLRQLGA